MKYKVTVPYAIFVTVEVEADSVEEAEDEAFDHIYVCGYAGNGGTDKLIGVTEGSIEVGEVALEDNGFSIQVEDMEVQ